MLTARAVGAGVRLLGAVLAAALLSAACTVARAPADLGPPFLRVARVARVFDVPAESPAAWSPSGDAVAAAGPDGVWSVPVGGGAPRRLSSLSGITALAWGPQSLGVAAIADDGLVLIDPGTLRAEPIAAGRSIRLPVWAPRGARLAYAQAQDAGDVIVVWDAADPGRPAQRLPLPDGVAAQTVAWSSEGRALIVAAGPPGSGLADRVVRIEIGGPHPVIGTAPLGGPLAQAALDPTGMFVAYAGRGANTDGVAPVIVKRVGSGNARAVTATGTYTGLSWAPSGDALAFGQVLGPDEVAVDIVNAVTGARLRVLDYRPELPRPGLSLAIRWSPDGLHLAFGTDTGDGAGPIWMATLARD